MAYTYDAGLRIRPPEPMPDCLSGESPQEYFARVLAQCSLESATSAENNSGDSAPTPFNIGQIQQDVARNAADIDTLEAEIPRLEGLIDEATGEYAGGLAAYDIGDTEVVVGFPSSGGWVVSACPAGVAPPDNWRISVTGAGFTVTFDAAAVAGTFSWVAIKIP